MVVSAGHRDRTTTRSSLEPGDTLGFQAALVIGRFFEGMLENAVQAQLTYDGAYLDCDQNPLTGVAGTRDPPCVRTRIRAGYLRYNDCDSICDCNPCESGLWRVRFRHRVASTSTPTASERQAPAFETGIDGKECLIHWLIGTAPPPPNMRLVAREGQVDILWDNSQRDDARPAPEHHRLRVLPGLARRQLDAAVRHRRQHRSGWRACGRCWRSSTCRQRHRFGHRPRGDSLRAGDPGSGRAVLPRVVPRASVPAAAATSRVHRRSDRHGAGAGRAACATTAS